MSERVAIITDIHANLPALEAELDRIDTLDADQIYCGGDLVGWGRTRTRSAQRSRAGSRRSMATTTTRSAASSRTAAAPT
jgi:Icc-related predicted phosphoesterase